MHKRVSITSEIHMYRHLLLIRQFSTEVKVYLSTSSGPSAVHTRKPKERIPAFSCLLGWGTPDFCKAYSDAGHIHPATLMP